jgi:ubiquinone/menaquinone biosynthesis C-methylase UbiE
VQNRSAPARSHGGAEFVAGSAVELPFADEAFDIVVASDGLYSWDLSAADRVVALAELRRVLRPGGAIVLTEHMRLHRFDQFIAEVRASGFCVRRIEYLYDRPAYQFESWIRAIQDWRIAKRLRRSVGLARALRAVGRIGGRRASRHVCVLAT